MSEDRLKKIINTFSQDVDSKTIPGFTSMIVRKGKVAQFEVYGYADMENKLPLKKDSLLMYLNFKFLYNYYQTYDGYF